MDLPQALAKLESLESILLQTVQELRSVKTEIQKQANGASLEQFLDAEQVAEILGVDVAHVHAQAPAGKIPSLTVGKYRRFSPAQLKKWLDSKSP